MGSIKFRTIIARETLSIRESWTLGEHFTAYIFVDAQSWIWLSCVDVVIDWSHYPRDNDPNGARKARAD